jgi:DNA-binding transcriptional LysR family regulator
LIARKKRPIELTTAGQAFYKAAKDILERYDQLKTELNALKNGVETRINVAAIFSIGMHSLPDYVKKFMIRYPTVNMHIEYFSADNVYELVLNGEFDIGLVAVPKKDRRLDVYEFEEELLVLVCSPKHPLAGETKADIHKLQFEPFIAFEKDVPTRIWIDNILSRYSTVVRTVMEFDNVETVKRAVEINVGVSILPQATVIQEVASGTLKAIPFSNERFLRPTGIIVRKGRTLSQATRYFIDLLRKQAK